jgi:ketosteroid isomerase-like protein
MTGDEQLRERNIGIVRAFMEALNGWDFPGMEKLMAEDFTIEFLYPAPGLPNRIEGREKALEFQRSFAEKIYSENMHDIDYDTRHSDPNVVLVTCKSDFDFKKPGLSYKNDYICFFEIEDGQLLLFQENFDSVRLVEGFGGSVESPF